MRNTSQFVYRVPVTLKTAHGPQFFHWEAGFLGDIDPESGMVLNLKLASDWMHGFLTAAKSSEAETFLKQAFLALHSRAVLKNVECSHVTLMDDNESISFDGKGFSYSTSYQIKSAEKVYQITIESSKMISADFYQSLPQEMNLIQEIDFLNSVSWPLETRRADLKSLQTKEIWSYLPSL